MSEIDCARCGQTEPGMDGPPLPNELGERIHAEICQRCWDEWLRYQTALINHYGLDVREKSARELLTRNMEAFFFETGETEEIDTSKEGSIEW